MYGTYKETKEKIAVGITGKTIDRVEFFLDALKLHFSDGSSLSVGLVRLEDAYDLDVVYMRDGVRVKLG